VPDLDKWWLETTPSRTQYVELIIKTFKTGLERIKCFERWSKHEQLQPYVDQLEDWDDIVGQPWEIDDSLYLDPKMWILDNPLYLNHKGLVTDTIESAFGKIERFLKRFQPLLEIYWRNKQLDCMTLVDENLQEPQQSLKNIICLFRYHDELFSDNLP
jgi:hypothetical protein